MHIIFMPSCEICGKNYENLEDTIIEGVAVEACNSCSKFGKVISIKKQITEKEKKIRTKPRLLEENIIDNYGWIIKKAREERGFRHEELAKNINEKESIIHKIETENLKPSITMAKKLENFLNIKLIEMEEEKKNVSLNFKDDDLTIGDLLKIKNRKV